MGKDCFHRTATGVVRRKCRIERAVEIDPDVVLTCLARSVLMRNADRDRKRGGPVWLSSAKLHFFNL